LSGAALRSEWASRFTSTTKSFVIFSITSQSFIPTLSAPPLEKPALSAPPLESQQKESLDDQSSLRSVLAPGHSSVG
jgi:hypothetical protein